MLLSPAAGVMNGMNRGAKRIGEMNRGRSIAGEACLELHFNQLRIALYEYNNPLRNAKSTRSFF